MKVEIIMPKMGESINEGTIIKWYKKVGDTIKKDEIIYEISTDKVDTEIPSPEDGVLVEIRAFENETVPINEVVAVIDTNGEAVKAEATKKKVEEPSTDQVGSIVDLPMPKMGESIVEGTIIKWHKKVGDSVKIDEIVYEITTDKVDTEVPSPVDGVIAEILFSENETVEVGVSVARIATKTGYQKIEKHSEDNEIEIKAEPKQKDVILKHSKPNVGSSNKFYSPVVLNIASKEGITANELELIKGNGIGGRITKKDVLKYIGERGSYQSTQTSSFSAKSSSTGSEIIPMDNLRKKIKQHMIKSRDTSVHVSEVMEVDMTVISKFIDKNKDRILKEDNLKLTYLAFISYAAVRALKEFPLVNSSIDGENIILKKDISLGIAVAVEPNGLLVPNIKNADERNVRGLAKAIKDIAIKRGIKALPLMI